MLQNMEFIQSFVEEARSHIENLEAGLLNMNTANIDPEEINNIFRAVHSIKGTAGFFSLKNIVELSHCMENLLGECRNGRLDITENMIDTLLSANDCLKSMVDDVENSESMDITKHISIFTSILAGEAAEVSGQKNEKKKDKDIIILDEKEEFIEISGSCRQKVIDGIKHGCRLYRVRRKLNCDLAVNGTDPIKFLDKIRSIGTSVECRTDIDEKPEDDGSSISDICFTFLFLSVLEKSLLSSAIDIPEVEIHELIYEAKAEDSSEGQGGYIDEEILPGEAGQMDGQKAVEALHEKKSQGVAVEDSIRVHVTLLNNLMNLASEMVLGRNQLLCAVENYRKNIPGIDPILQNIDHITTDLQETIMQTRMQPIANVFNKFPRIIRDLSKKLGKEMDLKLEGTDVELDKSIIEALGDPLIHLVRNAADHGLELPSERESCGKPRTGVITLKAYHEGGCVNIDVIDDGKGVDLERIKEKALENRLIDNNELSVISEQEALQLLFKPGFSTAEKITDVSGRGVGMDVVKTNIEKLGGTIEIFTNKGKGTTFRLLLPLTLAIIPSLIVEVENQRFALPQVNLQEIVRIKPGDASKKIEYVYNSEVLRLRGRLLPIVHLADVLGLNRTYIDPATSERKEERRKTLYDQRRKDAYVSREVPSGAEIVDNSRKSNANIIRILVLKIGSRRFGIAVDMIHGSEEILVKSLPRFIKDCRCYSGVTIMGDGKVAMIVDPEGIIQKASLRFAEGMEEKSDKDMAAVFEDMKEKLNLLLFKCSGSEMFGIDLSLVSRVEEINPDDIERIGDKEYIKFRGSSLRVIRPEYYLPVSSVQKNTTKFYVIIPKLVKHPMGILIEKVHDTVQTNIRLDQENIRTRGLIGSFILNNRIVLLINIYELFELVDPEHYAVKDTKIEGERNRVLLVEDTPFFLKLEISYLEAAGYRVQSACNGKEALQLLQENEFDIVVSDINMPLMDGLELVKRIRSDKRFEGLPVIAVTSLTEERQVKVGMDAGFDFYEFKLDRSNLLEKVELALQKRRQAI